jgi:hypothetical protein
MRSTLGNIHHGLQRELCQASKQRLQVYIASWQHCAPVASPTTSQRTQPMGTMHTKAMGMKMVRL